MRTVPRPEDPAAPEAREAASLRAELDETRRRLREVEYLLEAIQSGKADALIISGPKGEEQVHSLKSLDVLLDSIVDNSLGATVLVDAEGRVLRASAQAAELAGEDPRGRAFGEAFPLRFSGDEGGGEGPAERAEPEAFAIADVLAGQPMTGREASFLRADGASLHLLVAAKALNPFGGLFRGAVVHLQDITARKRAEVQLLVRTKQLRYHFELTKTITDNAAEALFLLDLEGRIVFMNPAAEDMLGWGLQELLGRSLHDIVHPRHAGLAGPSRCCALAELLASGYRVGVNEDAFQRANGAELPVRYSKAPVISDGKVTGAVLGVGDVSKRNETEAALRLSEEKLRQSQKMEAVGRLAGGIAHDFNNLLTAINGYAALGMDSVDAADPLHGYLSEIHKAGERAASLTSQLLAYSRKQILTLKTVDLNQLVAETSAILRRTLPETILHEVELGEGPLWVRADPARIQQVLVNLAINARDAMPGGGVLRLATRLQAVLKPDRSGLLGEMAREAEGGLTPGTWAQVTVSDTGHGMDDNVKSHLFEPFFTTKEVGKGTGLGLSMAYGIVKQSGGHIQVFSEPGRGTTLNLLLPQVREEARPAPPSGRPGIRARGEETVLLAEDEEAVLRLLRQVLVEGGYKVLEARDGKEALALAEAFPGRIDLLVTDMVMAGMGGQELAENLRRSRPGTRSIFISGYTDDILFRNGVDADGTVFLQKPFSPEVLARTVRQTLDAPA